MLRPVNVNALPEGRPAGIPVSGPALETDTPVKIVVGPAAAFAKAQVEAARLGPRQTEAFIVDLPSSFQSEGRDNSLGRFNGTSSPWSCAFKLEKLIKTQVIQRPEHTMVIITGHARMVDVDQVFVAQQCPPDTCHPACIGWSVHVKIIVRWLTEQKTKCTLFLNGCRHPGNGRRARQPKSMATKWVDIIYSTMVNHRVMEIVPVNPIRQSFLRAHENGLRAGRTPREILEDLHGRPGNSDMKEYRFEADLYNEKKKK